MAIEQSKDLGRPKPFQIARGTNNINLRKLSNELNIDERHEDFEFTILDLEPDTAYNLYFTAGSAHPGYPDLLDEEHTQQLAFKTPPLPIGMFISASIKYKQS